MRTFRSAVGATRLHSLERPARILTIMTRAVSVPDADTPVALAILLENHRAFLWYLERRVGDRELAEDILQDAFIKVMDRPDQTGGLVPPEPIDGSVSERPVEPRNRPFIGRRLAGSGATSRLELAR